MCGDPQLEDCASNLYRKCRGIVASTSRPFARELRGDAIVDHDTRSRDDDEMREVEDLAPAMPCRQAEERIGADDQREPSAAILGAQLLECGHREASALAPKLTGIDFQTRMIRDGKLDHCQPLRRGCHRRRSVRGIAGGNEANRGKLEGLPQFTRELQMSAMDRIERAAEDAENRLHCDAEP